ncbi:MAG: DMT family transporter [Oscillospiraceae bacterium]|jgi:DME family drug/metabolite transporter
MTKTDIKKAYVFIAGAAILWGAIGIFVRRLTAEGLTNEQAIFIRVTVAAAVMVIVALIRGPALLRIRLRDIWIFIGTGGVGIAIDNIFYFRAIELTSMSTAAMLMYTAPIFVMLMSALFYGERITRRKLLCLFLAVSGSIFISNVFSQGPDAFPAAGVLCGIASGLGYALYSIIAVYGLRRYDTFTVTAYTFVFAAITSAAFAKPWLIFTEHATYSVLLNGLGLGVLCCTLPYFLYTRGLRDAEAGRASITASIEPLAATVFGFLFFDEKPTLMTLIGILLIIGSIVILNLNIKLRTHKR